jgi:hypothetical protein
MSEHIPLWYALMRVKAIRPSELGPWLDSQPTPPRFVLAPLWTTIDQDEDGRGHAGTESEFTIAIGRITRTDLRVDRALTREEAVQTWRERHRNMRFLLGVQDNALTRPRFTWAQPDGPADGSAQIETRALAARDREWGAAWGAQLDAPTPGDLESWVAVVRRQRDEATESISKLESEVVNLRKGPVHLKAIADELAVTPDLAAVLKTIRTLRSDAMHATNAAGGVLVESGETARQLEIVLGEERPLERAEESAEIVHFAGVKMAELTRVRATLVGVANTLGAAGVGTVHAVAQDRMHEIEAARVVDRALRVELDLGTGPGQSIIDAVKRLVAERRLASEAVFEGQLREILKAGPGTSVVEAARQMVALVNVEDLKDYRRAEEAREALQRVADKLGAKAGESALDAAEARMSEIRRLVEAARRAPDLERARMQTDELARAMGYEGGAPPWSVLIHEVTQRADVIRMLQAQVSEMAPAGVGAEQPREAIQIDALRDGLRAMVGAGPTEDVLTAVSRRMDELRRAGDEINKLRQELAEMGEEMARGADPQRLAEAVASLPHVDGTEYVTVAIGECLARVRAGFERHNYEPSIVDAIERGVRGALIASGAAGPPAPGSHDELKAIIESNAAGAGAPRVPTNDGIRRAKMMEDVNRELARARRMRAALTPFAGIKISHRGLETVIDAALAAAREKAEPVPVLDEEIDDGDDPFAAQTREIDQRFDDSEHIADEFVSNVQERAAELVARILTGT